MPTGGPEIAEDLRGVHPGEAPTSLHLNNQAILDEEIGDVEAEGCAVLVQYAQDLLPIDRQSASAQPMRQSVLVDFLEMSVPEVGVQGEGGLADLVTEVADPAFVSHSRRGVRS